MRRVLFAIFVLLLCGLTATAWYAYDKGFTKKWRGFVTQEFRKQGLEVTIRKMTLDPFRGLVAREVKVYDARDRRRVLAEVDRLMLGINYSNALQGKTFLDTLDLRDANLSLPIDPANPGGHKVVISKLNARLFLPPQQIYLARAEAEVYGLRVYLAGRVINPQAFRPKKGERKEVPIDLIKRVLEELDHLDLEGNAPLISLQFSGDLAEPSTVVAEARLQGEKIRRRGYLIESLDVAATYRGGRVELQKLELKDEHGLLQAHARVEPGMREANLRVQSTIDAPALIRAFHITEQFEEVVFYDPPALDVTGKFSLGEELSLQLRGEVGLGKFGYRSVIFDGMKASASWDGGRWSVRDVELEHRTGRVTGDVMQIPGSFRARLRSTINPKLLMPLLSGKVAEWFSQFDFKDSPTFELEVDGPEPVLEACTIKGRMDIAKASYRGIPAKRFVSEAVFVDRRLTLGPFRVERREGSGSGTMIFDFKRDEVRFEKVRANVHPKEIAGWIHPRFIKDIAPYRFKGKPPNVLLNGVVHTKGGKSTRLSVEVDAPGGMDYTFLGKTLASPAVSGKLSFTDSQFRIDTLDARLYGGHVRGQMDFSTVKKRPGYRANLQLESVDFASLTKLYFNYDSSKGRLAGNFDFRGRHDQPRSLNGSGKLSVTDGNVFAIPFLGPFSSILNGIVPGMGYNVARRADATFAVSNGAISTNDLEIMGAGFSMYGRGKLFYLDDRMDFSMRINARGLPGVLLFPVSKLFEYVSDEKLSKPSWRPRALRRL